MLGSENIQRWFPGWGLVNKNMQSEMMSQRGTWRQKAISNKDVEETWSMWREMETEMKETWREK